MKTLTAAALATLLIAACDQHPPSTHAQTDDPSPTPLRQATITLPPDTPRPPFDFADRDEALLDEITAATLRYFTSEIDPDTGMVFDRTSANVISVAGVGFQLGALAIGAERELLDRKDANEHTLRILTALDENPTNRKHGLFFHYLQPGTAAPTTQAYETLVSTIDSAILFAGMVVASSYFGGDVAAIADRLVADADWTPFISGDEANPGERGFISLGWKPSDTADPTGAGAILPFYWVDSGDEHLLVNFLAVAAPNDAHRPDPDIYYRLRRRLGAHNDIGPFVWFPWSGALFTNVFAHLWIDYAAMPPDDPGAHGVANRPRVDWWANSAMAIDMHRAKAIENPRALPTLGPNAWGLTACDSRDGYLVPGLFPTPIPMPGARPDLDFAAYTPTDNWGDGTLAPYAPAMAIMFRPEHALAALRHYRSLTDAQGDPLVWRDDLGFLDSFNLDGPWVAHDRVAIDQGPLLLAIENARTGFLWRQFHAHPFVRGAMDRLGLETAK